MQRLMRRGEAERQRKPALEAGPDLAVVGRMQDVVTAIMLGVASFFVMRFLLAMRSRISGPKARAEVEAGALLLDVRSPSEYGGGSLPGAKNIPVQSLSQRFAELDAKRSVVVFCASGMRSARAANLLRGKGFTVHDLGPARAW